MLTLKVCAVLYVHVRVWVFLNVPVFAGLSPCVGHLGSLSRRKLHYWLWLPVVRALCAAVDTHAHTHTQHAHTHAHTHTHTHTHTNTDQSQGIHTYVRTHVQDSEVRRLIDNKNRGQCWSTHRDLLWLLLKCYSLKPGCCEGHNSVYKCTYRLTYKRRQSQMYRHNPRVQIACSKQWRAVTMIYIQPRTGLIGWLWTASP